MKLVKQSLYFIVLVALASCDGFFGTKTNLDFIETPEYLPREVAYVPVQPQLTNFVNPVDIIAGFDELIYADGYYTQHT